MAQCSGRPHLFGIHEPQNASVVDAPKKSFTFMDLC